MDTNNYLTMNDLMKRFKVTRATLYNWIKKGLPSIKVGGVRRFRESEVNDWVNNNSTQD